MSAFSNCCACASPDLDARCLPRALVWCGHACRCCAQDSKFGGKVRSGSEYYNNWDKAANQLIKEIEQEEAEGDANQGRMTGSQTAGSKAQVPIRVTRVAPGMTAAERTVLAEDEKAKGNEFFRWAAQLPSCPHLATASAPAGNHCSAAH